MKPFEKDLSHSIKFGRTNYKLGNKETTVNIDNELKQIAISLSISNRIETITKREAFISLKDHKENFQNNPTCRLINSAKSECGKVSKVLLDSINQAIRHHTNVNQWRNSQAVIDWYKGINDKNRHSFLSFDIVDFYPSVSEDLVDKAISRAQQLTTITTIMLLSSNTCGNQPCLTEKDHGLR